MPLGGHAIIEANVVIGGNSAVQQFTRIGKMAMIGGMTGVLHDTVTFPRGLSRVFSIQSERIVSR